MSSPATKRTDFADYALAVSLPFAQTLTVRSCVRTNLPHGSARTPSGCSASRSRGHRGRATGCRSAAAVSAIDPELLKKFRKLGGHGGVGAGLLRVAKARAG